MTQPFAAHSLQHCIDHGLVLEMKLVVLAYQYFFTEDCKLCADAEVLTRAILPLALRKANHSVLQADAYSALEKTRLKFVLPHQHLPLLLQDSVQSLEKVCTLVQTGLKSGTHNGAQYSPGGLPVLKSLEG